MGHPQLDNLARIGKLKTEPAAETEPRGLLRSGTRRLDDAAREELSFESRFDLAYNAAHVLALAALRRLGTPNAQIPPGAQYLEPRDEGRESTRVVGGWCAIGGG